MSHDVYLRYEPSVEQPQPDEVQTIKAIVASIIHLPAEKKVSLGLWNVR